MADPVPKPTFPAAPAPKPNVPAPKPPTPAPAVDVLSLEERMTALENVVHALVPNVQHSSQSPHVAEWLKNVGERLKVDVKKVI